MENLLLYSDGAAPPCRAVLLTTEVLGIEITIREINIARRDNMTDEFVKINIQHTVPTLDDKGFVLWDSHAIMCYLVDKYGPNDTLYPKDEKKRARVHQRLHFNSGILFAHMRGICHPIFYKGVRTVSQEKKDLLKEAYDLLNKFLAEKQWLAGDNFTLADISCVTTVTSLDVFVPIANYPNIVRWVETCEREMPGYERINNAGNQIFRETFERLLL